MRVTEARLSRAVSDVGAGVLRNVDLGPIEMSLKRGICSGCRQSPDPRRISCLQSFVSWLALLLSALAVCGRAVVECRYPQLVGIPLLRGFHRQWISGDMA